MTTLSVVINTINEEPNLPRALTSIKNLADEIVVVDMHSDDKTVEIAKKFKAKVFDHARTNIVEPARNFAISKATSEWILILDADEEIPESLVKKIQEIIKDDTADYFRLPRKNLVFGKWLQHSRWWPDYNIRLFKKGSVTWNEMIHSVPLTVGRGADLPAEEEYSIIHHHYVTVEQYIEKLNNYTSEHAKLLVKEDYKFEWQDLLKKPANEFFSRFFFGEGYKDGIHGLALSSLQAFSELVLYLKVWQHEKFLAKKLHIKEIVSTMRTIEPDMHYWQADTLLKEHGGLIQRFKRKFKLP